MRKFVQVIVVDCEWKPGYYAAFHSTANNYYLDVYLKKARTLMSALTSKTRWVEQGYQIPWVDLISPWYQTHSGAEILLWTNDFPWTTNDFPRVDRINMGIRFVTFPMKWVYATIRVPKMTPAQMTLRYLKWGCRFFDYASDVRCKMLKPWDGNTVWPLVYPPQGILINEVRDWVVSRAVEVGYEDRIPFIMKVIDYFVDERWQCS